MSYYFKDVDESKKLRIWKKGKEVQGYDGTQYRQDICGSWMQYSAHGDRNSKFGWEIDHIKPESKGGSDDDANLQPLHWSNNAKKADKHPWTCGQ